MWGQLDLSVLLPELFAKFKNLEKELSSEGSGRFLAEKDDPEQSENAISCHLVKSSYFDNKFCENSES